LPEDPLELSPLEAVNPAGTEHTVTASISDPNGAIDAGRPMSFEVAGVNAGVSGSCSVNPDCTTANDEVSFTYLSNGNLGADTITACFTDDQCVTHCASARKTWEDGTAPEAACTSTINPHGSHKPRAGKLDNPKSGGGQNEDGFYRVSATDDRDDSPEIWILDTGSGSEFGPFPSGTDIKYTEAGGASPSQKTIGSGNGSGGAVEWHITGRGDMAVYAVDDAGNQSDPVLCLVPRPPK